MSMPVQLSRQQSEEKENGLGGYAECSDSSQGCESPVKKHRGVHLSSSKGLMVSRCEREGTWWIGSSPTVDSFSVKLIVEDLTATLCLCEVVAL